MCIRKINESLNQQSVEIDKQHWTEGRTDHQATEVHTKGQEDRQQRKSQTERQSDREADLHLLHDEVGAEDGVPFLWVLPAMFLCPRGLPGRRETNHHKDLEKRVNHSAVCTQSIHT